MLPVSLCLAQLWWPLGIKWIGFINLHSPRYSLCYRLQAGFTATMSYSKRQKTVAKKIKMLGCCWTTACHIEVWRRPPGGEFPKLRRHWQRLSSIFQRLDRYFVPPFHYLPVIPLLLTIPLSPCKLTQRLWTLAAFFLIGSLRLKLSSDKTKALDSYAAPS